MERQKTGIDESLKVSMRNTKMRKMSFETYLLDWSLIYMRGGLTTWVCGIILLWSILPLRATMYERVADVINVTQVTTDKYFLSHAIVIVVLLFVIMVT